MTWRAALSWVNPRFLGLSKWNAVGLPGAAPGAVVQGLSQGNLHSMLFTSSEKACVDLKKCATRYWWMTQVEIVTNISQKLATRSVESCSSRCEKCHFRDCVRTMLAEWLNFKAFVVFLMGLDSFSAYKIFSGFKSIFLYQRSRHYKYFQMFHRTHMSHAKGQTPCSAPNSKIIVTQPQSAPNNHSNPPNRTALLRSGHPLGLNRFVLQAAQRPGK